MDAQASIHGFSGAVLILKGDQTLLRKAYGLADREWGIANTVDTRFRIASISKTFTAVGIMKLVESGRLSLDDKLERYIPGFPHGGEITIRMLLNHSSGLARDHDDLAMDMTMSRERALPILRAKALRFMPGTQIAYSNSAYLLLSYIIEDVSGQSYREFMHANVFKPAGLDATGIVDPENLLNKRARHYWFSARDAGVHNEVPANYSMFQGHGNLYSTVDDLARFFNGLRRSSLLSGPTLEKMLTRGKDGALGLGLMFDKVAGRDAFGHNGGSNGARNQVFVFPDDDLVTVVSSNNSADAVAMSQALAAMAFGQDVELPTRHVRAQIDPRLFEAHVGRYRRTRIHISNGKLMDGDVELVPESQTRFFARSNHQYIYEFIPAANGRSGALVFSDHGVKITIPRNVSE
jgi:CubicO group peptidase (beta-lactamase class C family)